MKYDILMAGNYFCDLIFSGLPAFPTLGTEVYTQNLTVVPGGILNTVVALRRLGMNVGWIGVLGNDFFSQYIREWIIKEQIDLHLVEQRDEPFQRVTVALSYPTDRAFVTYVDKPPNMIERLIQHANENDIRCLHFNSLVVDERLPEFIKACRQRGILVTMDCQHREETLEIPLVRDILSELDIFMPNAIEAQRLTQTNTLTNAMQILSEIVPMLVIKDGKHGAHALHDGKSYFSAALSLNAIDTTGAGDVFNAGFLSAHLRGYDLETCLKWGNIAGGLSTLGYGGCSTAPTLVELESHLG
jgi:sugar/nucleoside kinase (ribokinase family)